MVYIFTKRLQHSCTELAIPTHDKLIPSLTSPDYAYTHHEGEKAEHELLYELHSALP